MSYEFASRSSLFLVKPVARQPTTLPYICEISQRSANIAQTAAQPWHLAFNSFTSWINRHPVGYLLQSWALFQTGKKKLQKRSYCHLKCFKGLFDINRTEETLLSQALTKVKIKQAWVSGFLSNPILNQIHKQEKKREEKEGRIVLHGYGISRVLFSLPV